MLLKLTRIVVKFFCKKVGKKVTHYFVCMIPNIALEGKHLEDDDYGIYNNLDCLIELETSFKKARKKVKELKKSFGKRYNVMIVEGRFIKRK